MWEDGVDVAVEVMHFWRGRSARGGVRLRAKLQGRVLKNDEAVSLELRKSATDWGRRGCRLRACATRAGRASQRADVSRMGSLRQGQCCRAR